MTIKATPTISVVSPVYRAEDCIEELCCRLRAALEPLTPESIEAMLRSLAEEKQVGLGKVAQPLRVAITGTTISPPIFEAVQMLGLPRTLARIERTLKQFQ